MSRQATILSPSDGQVFLVGPFRIVARVLGEQTQGAFELYDLTLGAATIDYHVHNTMDETLCVVEGEVEFTVAGEKFLRKAGSVAFVPRGIHHGFTNHCPAPARVLITFNPPTNQQVYFAELERLFAAPTLDNLALEQLRKRYDQELVPLDG